MQSLTRVFVGCDVNVTLAGGPGPHNTDVVTFVEVGANGSPFSEPPFVTLTRVGLPWASKIQL